MKNRVIIIALAKIFGMASAASAFCQRWEQARSIGQLDPAILKEASGLAISQNFTGRFYHVNDSGDGPKVYITNSAGQVQKSFLVDGFSPFDVEDLGYGDCPSAGKCLFIADIGDNGHSRKTLSIVLVQELEDFPQTAAPVQKITLQYPDGSHDAESFAVHPNGDLFLLTKEYDSRQIFGRPALVFRVSKEAWQSSDGTPLVMESVGEIDIPYLGRATAGAGQMLTSFDIAPDGQSFALLTYASVFEFAVDLSKDRLTPTRQMQRGVDYQIATSLRIDQYEALSYLEDSSLVFTRENRGQGAPVMQVDCLD